MGTEREKPDCSKLSRIKNFTNEGGYNFRFRYLKNIMGLWLIQCVKKELNNRFSFAELSEMAEITKIKAIIDVNDNRLFSPQNMIEAIQNLCRETGGQIPEEPCELAAVIYNSLALSYSRTAAELEEITGETYEKICIVGGGAKVEYLNKLTAKYCNKIVIAGHSEATAIGNLAVQMIAAGIFPNITAARECIKNSYN